MALTNELFDLTGCNDDTDTDTYDLLADLMHWIEAQNGLSWAEWETRSEARYERYSALDDQNWRDLADKIVEKSEVEHQKIEDTPAARVKRLDPFMEKTSPDELIAALRFQAKVLGQDWDWLVEAANNHYVDEREQS